MSKHQKENLSNLESVYLAFGIGAIANVSVASYVFEHEYSW